MTHRARYLFTLLIALVFICLLILSLRSVEQSTEGLYAARDALLLRVTR